MCIEDEVFNAINENDVDSCYDLLDLLTDKIVDMQEQEDMRQQETYNTFIELESALRAFLGE